MRSLFDRLYWYKANFFIIIKKAQFLINFFSFVSVLQAPDCNGSVPSNTTGTWPLRCNWRNPSGYYTIGCRWQKISHIVWQRSDRRWQFTNRYVPTSFQNSMPLLLWPQVKRVKCFIWESVTVWNYSVCFLINEIVVSDLWGPQCVRLKVTVKSDNCGENAQCSGKGVCFSNASMVSIQLNWANFH